MVENKNWMVNFLEASVHHFSISILDHYLLALFLKRSQPRKLVKKHFLFETMWTRDDGCRKVCGVHSEVT